jgi:serine/threonine-protein kinase RsbW
MVHAHAPGASDWSRPRHDRWQRLFRGQEGELRQLREWLTALLPDGPARDDLISVAVELGTNAIQHTASGNGGRFMVEVACLGPATRVSVTDEGAASEPCLTEDPFSEHGRGLIIVRALSVTSGVCGDASGRTVWAEIAHCSPPPGSPPASPFLAGQGRSSRPSASSAMAISRTL